MIGLFNLRWAGTPEEFKEYIGRIKSLCEEIEGIVFKGVYIPQTEWQYTMIMEVDSANLNLTMEMNRKFIQKYGRQPLAAFAWTYLVTFEEYGIPSPE